MLQIGITETKESQSEIDKHILSEDSRGYDSDHISSDIEVELYSQIHHERFGAIGPKVKNISLEPPVISPTNSRISGKNNQSGTPKKLCSLNPESSKSSLPIILTTSELTARSKRCRTDTTEHNNSITWKIIGDTKSDAALECATKSKQGAVNRVSFSLFKCLGLSKMTDSECEIIKIGKVEDNQKNIPVVTVNSSSDSDCIVESVFRQTEDVKLNVLDLKETPKKHSANSTQEGKVTDKRDKIRSKRQGQARKRKKEDAAERQYWKVDPRDRLSSSFKKTKDYRQKALFNRVICYNCREAGHLSRNCTSAKRFITCYICGIEGHHGDRCTNPVCPKCLIVGHPIKYCLWDNEYLEIECPICNLPGHLREECPDVWRRYHLTLTPGEIVRSEDSIKEAQHSWCHNCGANGHLGIDCAKKKLEFYLFPSDMSICSYDDPLTELPFSDSYVSKLAVKEDLKLKSMYHHKYRLASESNRRFARENRIPPIKRLRTLSSFASLGTTYKKMKHNDKASHCRSENNSILHNNSQSRVNDNQQSCSQNLGASSSFCNGDQLNSNNESPSKLSFPIENLYGWQKKMNMSTKAVSPNLQSSQDQINFNNATETVTKTLEYKFSKGHNPNKRNQDGSVKKNSPNQLSPWAENRMKANVKKQKSPKARQKKRRLEQRRLEHLLKSGKPLKSIIVSVPTNKNSRRITYVNNGEQRMAQKLKNKSF